MLLLCVILPTATWSCAPTGFKSFSHSLVSFGCLIKLVTCVNVFDNILSNWISYTENIRWQKNWNFHFFVGAIWNSWAFLHKTRHIDKVENLCRFIINGSVCWKMVLNQIYIEYFEYLQHSIVSNSKVFLIIISIYFGFVSRCKGWMSIYTETVQYILVPDQIN